MKLGILPLGRPTFDVDYANEKLSAMLACLDASGHDIIGPRSLLLDGDATRETINALKGEAIDRLLILQVTFTDAAMTVAAASANTMPLSIWAVPEPRLGGRLRLNAFCGLNLASHALGLRKRPFNWAYADADTVDLDTLLSDGSSHAPHPKRTTATEEGARISAKIAGSRIARIGEHPEGFDTCAYKQDALKALADISVDEVELETLFDAARSADASKTQQVRAQAEADLTDLAEVDQEQLDRSLKMKVALDAMRAADAYDAFAIRCWPETFTEYGGAVCGPVSMMGEARLPCACEADVYGALTQLILQEAAQAPVFLTDLVDVDCTDNSAVVWHCGQAPISMRAGEATATIHTNRKMPLLYEFKLKPGGVTLMRISQAFGETKMILARGEMLDRPMSFTGTSGVLRFDRPADAVLNDIISSGLEHHMAIAYGDHLRALEGTAAALNIPVVRL
ncbi:MAG: hypothetical protein OXR62_05100 [Ahrensia sp.]|nr:hypothetical protein [Ahrensia sp.]